MSLVETQSDYQTRRNIKDQVKREQAMEKIKKEAERV